MDQDLTDLSDQIVSESDSTMTISPEKIKPKSTKSSTPKKKNPLPAIESVWIHLSQVEKYFKNLFSIDRKDGVRYYYKCSTCGVGEIRSKELHRKFHRVGDLLTYTLNNVDFWGN